MGMQYGRQAEGSRTNVYIVSFVINWRCWIFYWRRSHWLWFWKRSRAMERDESRWRRPSPASPRYGQFESSSLRKKGCKSKFVVKFVMKLAYLVISLASTMSLSSFKIQRTHPHCWKVIQLSLRIRLSCVTRNPCSYLLPGSGCA